MSRRWLLWLGLIPAFGCGPSSSFTGIYSGTIQQTTTCGTTVNDTLFQLTLALVENHDVVTDQDPSCPGIGGQATQNIVKLDPFTCPAAYDTNDDADTLTVTSGTWTLNEDATQVAVSLQGTLNIESQRGATETCTTVWSGSLDIEK